MKRDSQLIFAVGAAAGIAATALTDGLSLPGTLVGGAFFGALSVATLVDLRERRVPNALTYGGTGIALLLAAGRGPEALALAGAGLGLALVLMGVAWRLGRGRLGLGDVKLAMFVGAVLGPAGVPHFLLTGTAVGAVAALILLLRGSSRSSAFAYAPYLAAGAAIALMQVGPIVR